MTNPTIVQPAAPAPSVDAFRTTGTSPTVHLLGAGAVGRALLEQLAQSHLRLVAVTDSSGTIHDRAGIDARRIAAWKAAGRALCEHRAAHLSAAPEVIDTVCADIVVDATSTEPGRAGWTEALDRALSRGSALAFAAKGALCDAGPEWLGGDHAARIGCNAVFVGTGRAYIDALTELRSRVRGVAIVGNASTSTIIDALERGATFASALDEARRLGYLEPDPELDLRGADAAVKLAIVAGSLTGRRVDPATIECDDIRTLEPLLLRSRARRAHATRLVARLGQGGSLRVAYEELPTDSIFAVPPGRVVYEYRLDRDERRLHVGTGLGARATAAALWTDVVALARTTAGAR